MTYHLPRRTFLSALGLGVVLGGCSEDSMDLGETYAILVMAAHGFFQARAVDDVPTINVFFDPQCRHCMSLWSKTRTLHELNFFWIPVAIMKGSGPIASKILRAADPPAAFEAFKEKGIISDAPSDGLQAVTDNTALLKQFDATGVPFLVGKKTDGSILTGQGEFESKEIRKMYLS